METPPPKHPKLILSEIVYLCGNQMEFDLIKKKQKELLEMFKSLELERDILISENKIQSKKIERLNGYLNPEKWIQCCPSCERDFEINKEKHSRCDSCGKLASVFHCVKCSS